MKNWVRVENHYCLWELETAIARFVADYNYDRLFEAIDNITPDDMYGGRQPLTVSRGEKIKHLTLNRRRKENLRDVA